jgi:hypothetical protein
VERPVFSLDLSVTEFGRWYWLKSELVAACRLLRDPSPVEMDRPFESVHTVNEFYDGPRLGVADFDGSPHVYRSLWLDSDDSNHEEEFELAPISPDAFAAVIEDWEIWRRFERAFYTGEVQWSGEESDWGALPAEGLRHSELQPAVAAALVIDESRRRVVRGEFRAQGPRPPDHRVGMMRTLEVRWVPVD